jgi:hypothetical protein
VYNSPNQTYDFLNLGEFRKFVNLPQASDPRTTNATKSGTTGNEKNNNKKTRPDTYSGSTGKTAGKGIKVNFGGNIFREPKTYRKAPPGMQESTEDSPERKYEKWGAKKTGSSQGRKMKLGFQLCT